MEPEMIDMVREFFVSRGIGELLVSAAVSSVIMALWIVTRRTAGIASREATRRMAPAAALSMIPLGWFAVGNFLDQQKSLDLRRGDAFTDISLVAPAFGFALTVLLLCAAVRLAGRARPSSETGGRWGNAVAYFLLLGLSYIVSFFIILFAVLPPFAALT